MWKKILSSILVMTVVVSCFGCASKQESSEEEKKVITVGWYTAWYLPSDYYDGLFEDFEAEHPEYTIEKKDVNSISELVSQVQSKTQPDVWLGGDPNNTDLTVGYYEGVFQSIDEYLEKDDSVNLDTMDLNQMKLTEHGGKYYGLPVHSTQQCLIYNKKLFAEAGLDPEHAPENWDEFYDYAKKMTKYDSTGCITQLGVSNGPWVYQLENSNGTTGSFKKDRISSNYDSEWIKTLNEYCNKFYELTDNKSAAKDVELDFSNGNVAMTIGDFQSISDVALERENMGIAYVPKPDGVDENYIPSLLFYFIGMPVECENPEGGWEFMKYLVTDGMYYLNSEKYLEKPMEYIPGQLAHVDTKQRVYDDFVSQVSDETKAFIEQRDTLLDHAKVVTLVTSPIQSTQKEIEEKWSNKMNEGEVGLSEALLGVHKEYEAQLSTWKKQQEAKGWRFPEGEEPIAP